MIKPFAVNLLSNWPAKNDLGLIQMEGISMCFSCEGLIYWPCLVFEKGSDMVFVCVVLCLFV